MTMYISRFTLLVALLGNEAFAFTLPGGSYCTWAPDLDCYPSTNGWPACCMSNDERKKCPEERQSCENATNATDIVVGSSYCTWAPDLDCYPSTLGWPACCISDNENETCPEERQSCENATNATEIVAGSSYCTWSPDLDCYPSTHGWPACCMSDNENDKCPKKRQSCENATNASTGNNVGSHGSETPTHIYGDSYCTWSPDLKCYPSTHGWPACCMSDNENEKCPKKRQPCENATNASAGNNVGSHGSHIYGDSYCTWSPDLKCYPSTNGWPACCMSANGTEKCPEERQPCENKTEAQTTPTHPMYGEDYCTWSPDLDCYPSTNGWPACCMQEGEAKTCPDKKAPCEKTNSSTGMVGGGGGGNVTSSPPYYCRAFAPEMNCYPSTEGFPACCSSNSEEKCPEEKPPCESSSSSSSVNESTTSFDVTAEVSSPGLRGDASSGGILGVQKAIFSIVVCLVASVMTPAF